MDLARSLFRKLQHRDKSESGKKKKDVARNTKEMAKPPVSEEAPSNSTKQKVAAAKQYIENHYKEQMKNLQERKERYCFLTSFVFLVMYFYLKCCSIALMGVLTLCNFLRAALNLIVYPGLQISIWLSYLLRNNTMPARFKVSKFLKRNFPLIVSSNLFFVLVTILYLLLA